MGIKKLVNKTRLQGHLLEQFAQKTHSLECEPPLSTYIGISAHAVSRNKTHIQQQLYQMGNSISYGRIMELEDWIATSTCEHFIKDAVITPACLWKEMFTVAAFDSLAHNPCPTTSVTSFHGTGISLFQVPT